MSSVEREMSRDRDMVIKHHASFSDERRPHVPMWDSSDPDRAPPPLPLNPGSPNLATRPNTSAAIAAAARQLEEKARESAPSSYTVNPTPSKSPERSLIKGAHHRRMQSMQTPSVKDLRTYIDGNRTPDRSPERPRAATPSPTKDNDKDHMTSPLERSSTRNATPTPSGRDILKDTPSLRPTSRPPPRAILGENGPPTSSTVLAIQNMQIKPLEPPLTDVTNSSSVKSPQALEALSVQLLNITNIASNLQKEMAQLSRRSKDNATDLLSLKEATNQRDEDIRKSLKDLVVNLNSSAAVNGGAGSLSRSGSALSDKAPVMTPPNATKFHLPRIPSPSSFILDDGISSPNPYSIEGAASVAMLEKIIREMVTKDGQERLLATLSTLLDKASHQSVETTKKVSELVEFIKDGRQSQALIRHPGTGPSTAGTHFQAAQTGSVSRPTRDVTARFDSQNAASGHNPKATEFVSQDMLDLLKKIKDSVGSSGGLTAEVKALVRDLKGEVLGMGRELGRRFDEASRAQGGTRALEGGSSDDVARIVSEGLVELKGHMERVIRENRRSSSSTSLSRSSVDNQEIYQVVKHALKESGLDGPSPRSSINKEEIISAVREAYEAYRPEMELQQFGLSREEILQSLREGLEEHRSRTSDQSGGITREEVMSAVQDALKDIHLPKPPTEAQEVRDEMLAAFRDCLEELKPQLMPDMQVEIDQDAIIEAVRAGMGGQGGPITGHGDPGMSRLSELLTEMRAEFKSYSSANGRDTEQVLDAVKDGLESLRSEIETYVDKAQDVTGKDEIMESMRMGLDALRSDLERFMASDGSISKAEILDYIKSEFEHLHSTLDSGSRTRDISEDINTQGALRTQIMAAIEAGFDGLGGSVSDPGSSKSHTNLIAFIKEELDHLRETMANTMVRSVGSTDKEDIIDALRESIDGLRSSLGSAQGGSSSEALECIQSELSHLRETLGSTLILSGSRSDKEDILEALRSGLQELNLGSGPKLGDESLAGVRSELDQIRQAITTGLAQRSANVETDEIVDTVRVGLDDLRSDLLKKLDNPDRFMSVQSDIIDALNEGLDNLKTEVTKAIDKPAEMTVTYEILDTLKQGIASIKDEMQSLSGGVRSRSSNRAAESGSGELAGNEVVLAEDTEAVATQSAPEPVGDMLRRNDLEKMEVMLAQLQIKVEAMDANIQNPPERDAPEPSAAGSVLKEDLVGIEAMLKDLQDSVAALASREKEDKEDTEAIETILLNTKAKIEELNFPDAETIATREQVEMLEGGLKAVNDAVDAIAAKIVDDAATRADVAVVEVMVQDLKPVLDEIKEAASKESDAITKADLDVLGVLCTEMKIRLEEMKLPDSDTLPQQADIEQLRGLIHDFRDSHDKLKESYETDIAITAKAFDDRKNEAADLVARIAGVKDFLEDLKEEIKAKLAYSASGVDDITDTVKSLEETIASNFNINADVKELMETVTREFDRAHGAIEGLKLDADEKSASHLEKHEEHREAIVAEFNAKLDEKFDALMSKFYDAHVAAEVHSRSMEDKAAQQEDILNGTRAMADELRLTIDTLGTSITALNATLNEVQEKLTQDSQTVYGRIDDTFAKMNENHDEQKEQHDETRKQVANTFAAINAIQSNMTEFHPKFMTSMKEVLALVNQHYEHSQKAQETACQQIREAAAEAKAHTEEIKTTFSGLPALLPAPLELPAPPEKYDDTPLQTKLDELLNKAKDPAETTVQVERLNEIHQQVMTTAAEISAFVASQTKLITEGHESREKEAEEVALLLERRLAQKEQLESDIQLMNDEKDSLRKAVEALRQEREELATQKLRLNADVSALQMALDIRREELNSMDAKAEKLERRILEGIMDHSRALLIAKSAAKNPTKPKPQRVPSNASQKALSTTPPALPASAAVNGLSMALKPRPAIKRGNAQSNNPPGRRILSLNRITENVPTGGHAYPPIKNTGMVAQSYGSGLKRSQSVKHAPSNFRNLTWLGGATATRETNKENEILSEESEGEQDKPEANTQLVLAAPPSEASTHEISLASPTEQDEEDHGSDAGTERRHSHSESVMSPSEDGYMYGSSYMTGSEVSGTQRSTSYGSTIRSTIGRETAIDEEDEEDGDEDSQHEEDEHEDEEKIETDADAEGDDDDIQDASKTGGAAKPVELVDPFEAPSEAVSKKLFVAPSESDGGLGTDPPTAALGSRVLSAGESEADYFRRMAEEESVVG